MSQYKFHSQHLLLRQHGNTTRLHLRGTAKGIPFRGLGSFHFYLPDSRPLKPRIVWDLKQNFFIYEINAVPIPDSDAIKSNVGSLVEFFPGFIGI